ncbi:MAG: hypothetical protein C0179_05430 [Fervidicoccus sp.]|nr:MAG: hypothetical protein C0179_05430 [Fervidicoccus sp.]
MGINDALTLLILRQLVGESNVLQALLEHVSGEGSSDVANRHGTTKYIVRSLRTRLYERLGSPSLAEELVIYSVPIILKVVEPVASKNVCKLCGRTGLYLESHILNSHRDLVNHYLSIVKSELKKMIEARAVNR